MYENINNKCYFFLERTRGKRKKGEMGKDTKTKRRKVYYSYNVSPNIQGQQNQCTLLCRSI